MSKESTAATATITKMFERRRSTIYDRRKWTLSSGNQKVFHKHCAFYRHAPTAPSSAAVPPTSSQQRSKSSLQILFMWHVRACQTKGDGPLPSSVIFPFARRYICMSFRCPHSLSFGAKNCLIAKIIKGIRKYAKREQLIENQLQFILSFFVHSDFYSASVPCLDKHQAIKIHTDKFFPLFYFVYVCVFVSALCVVWPSEFFCFYAVCASFYTNFNNLLFIEYIEYAINMKCDEDGFFCCSLFACHWEGAKNVFFFRVNIQEKQSN